MDPYVVLMLWALVVVAIFLMCREIVCWYFKINETNALLRDIGRALGAEPAPGSTQVLPRWLVGAPAGTYLTQKPTLPEPKTEDSLA